MIRVLRRQIWRLVNLVCRGVGHHESVRIDHGWAATECRRCGLVTKAEHLPEVEP